MPNGKMADVETGFLGSGRETSSSFHGCKSCLKSLVGEGWDFLVDLYWPRDGVHFCTYICFLFSCAWTAMWLNRLSEGQCGKFGVLLIGAPLCFMEILGLLVYFTMAIVCLKVIWYYDDDLQSRTLELQGEFASFLAATVSALSRAEQAIAELQAILDCLAQEICQSRARDALRLLSRIHRWERSSPSFPVKAKEITPSLARLLFLPQDRAEGLLAVSDGDIVGKSEQLADVCCASWTKRLGDFRATSRELRRNPVELTGEQIDKGIAIVAAFKPDGQEDPNPYLDVGGCRIPLRGSFDSMNKAALLKLQAEGYNFLYYERSQSTAPLGSFDFAGEVVCCIPHMCYFLPRALATLLRCGGYRGGHLWGCMSPSVPSYPRRLAVGCWSILLQSRLHEQVLLSLGCAAIFCTYNAATVVVGLAKGCPHLEAGTCTTYLHRKCAGTVLTAVYVCCMSFCCRSISRLDPVVVLCDMIVRLRTGFKKVQVFNAAVQSDVELARSREEVLRQGKEYWKRVGRCIDRLDSLDYTEANVSEAVRLLRALQNQAEGET